MADGGAGLLDDGFLESRGVQILALSKTRDASGPVAATSPAGSVAREREADKKNMALAATRRNLPSPCLVRENSDLLTM